MNMECRGFGKVLTRHHKMLNGLAGASLITLILKLKLDFPINESPGLLIWMAAVLILLWAANVATRMTDEQSRLNQLSRTNQTPAIGEDLILLLPRDHRNLPLTYEERKFLRDMDTRYRALSHGGRR